jgi:hypothetical protein
VVRRHDVVETLLSKPNLLAHLKHVRDSVLDKQKAVLLNKENAVFLTKENAVLLTKRNQCS